MNCKGFLFCLAWLSCFERITSIIVWDNQKHDDGTTIEIPEVHMRPAENTSSDNPYYKLVNPIKKYTIDEKCEKGIDFGVGFQVYTPYVNIGIGGFGSSNVLSGITPHLTNELMRYCCKADTKISYGHYFKSILEIEEHFEDDSEIDFSFPVYGLDGKKSTHFKDFPFIPMVTAPKIVVLVPDVLFQDLNTRTQVLMKTIFNAWPMLIFIIVSAMLSGLTVWLLENDYINVACVKRYYRKIRKDRGKRRMRQRLLDNEDKKKNADEFPPTFFSGAWEGIWWAFVTMTTVGYGDRSPKSPYARAFCILWILMGIILISLFTGLVTAALSASATPVFNIPGSKVGAVRGSIEYQVGVGMNADMKAFDNHIKLLEELMNTRKLHAVMIDNFILSASADLLHRTKLRMEREIDHPVTYGLVMRQNSTKTEACFRKYVRHYPQKVFEIISKNLVPVKNPTDEVSLEVAAAEKLFYEEAVFKNVVYTETGLLIAALFIGVMWEMFVRNKDSAAYRMVGKLRGKPAFEDGFDLDDKESQHENDNHPSKNSLDAMISEYEEFHQKWIQSLRHANKRNNSFIGKTSM